MDRSGTPVTSAVLAGVHARGGKSEEAPAPGAPPAAGQAPDDLSCPPVSIRAGASTYQVAAPGKHVVNISSLFGLMAVPGQSAYNAAKFGVRGFTEALRQEMLVAGHPVRVEALHGLLLGEERAEVVQVDRARVDLVDRRQEAVLVEDGRVLERRADEPRERREHQEDDVPHRAPWDWRVGTSSP